MAMLARHSYFAYDGVQNERCGTGTWFVNRVSPSCAQARRLLSVLKVIARREGGRRLWKSRSDFQGAVGAFSASMAPTASRALQARQSSWQRPRRLPLGCRTHPGLAASLPPPRVALRTPQRPILLYMILYTGGGAYSGLCGSCVRMFAISYVE